MDRRTAFLLGSFILPLLVLYGAYKLSPDLLLTGSFLDSSSELQMGYAADTIFEHELFAMAGSLSIALILGVAWGMTFGRSRVIDDEGASSRRASWWTFCAVVLLSGPTLFWWFISRAPLSVGTVGFEPLLLAIAIAIAASGLVFWLTSHILSTPEMLPSIPGGVTLHRALVLRPEIERRNKR